MSNRKTKIGIMNFFNVTKIRGQYVIFFVLHCKKLTILAVNQTIKYFYCPKSKSQVKKNFFKKANIMVKITSNFLTLTLCHFNYYLLNY